MGCYDIPGLIPLDEALAEISTQVSAHGRTETINIADSLNRIVAEDIVAAVNVPPQDNSAMDGYAVRAADLPSSSLTVIGESFAGHPFSEALAPHTCVRIMTGAIVPQGADCIVMQEEAVRYDSTVEITKAHAPQQFIRQAGSDISLGATVLTKGQRLGAAELGLLASLGVATVNVFEKTKVALMSTGDELKLPEEQLKAGEIYESNRSTLIALLADWPVDIIDLGIIADDKASIRQAFDKAMSRADLLITSGGVSVGEADFVREILDEKGKVGFWRLAIKPGKPLAFGQLASCMFLGLPGNPVSSMVTFIQVGQPLLRCLSGEQSKQPLLLTATLGSTIKKRAGRRDFQRGIVTNQAGKLIVNITGNQQSNILTSMAQANCFIVLPEEQGNVAAGDQVTIQLFSDLF